MGPNGVQYNKHNALCAIIIFARTCLPPIAATSLVPSHSPKERKGLPFFGGVAGDETKLQQQNIQLAIVSRQWHIVIYVGLTTQNLLPTPPCCGYFYRGECIGCLNSSFSPAIGLTMDAYASLTGYILLINYS